MSRWHTCPCCAIDQTRRTWDEPDRGTLCERCSESREFEFGRLAAIRADVLYAARQFEREAAANSQSAIDMQRVVDLADFLYGGDRRQLESDIATKQRIAERFSARAADCRRWLEATR